MCPSTTATADAALIPAELTARSQLRGTKKPPASVLLYGAAASDAPRRDHSDHHRLPQDPRGAEPPHRHPVPGDAERGHRAAVPQRVLEQPRVRHLRRRRLGPAAVLVDRQVRQPHRMAQLHEADRARRRHDQDRLEDADAAHRGALVGRPESSGSRLQGRTAGCRRPEILHELGFAALRRRRRARGAGLRRVPEPVPHHRHTTTAPDTEEHSS